MPANTTTLAVWGVNALLAIVIGVIGYDVKREIARDDDQEVRIRKIEQTCVVINMMQTDITEVKQDVKELLKKRP